MTLIIILNILTVTAIVFKIYQYIKERVKEENYDQQSIEQIKNFKRVIELENLFLKDQNRMTKPQLLSHYCNLSSDLDVAILLSKEENYDQRLIERLDVERLFYQDKILKLHEEK